MHAIVIVNILLPMDNFIITIALWNENKTKDLALVQNAASASVKVRLGLLW